MLGLIALMDNQYKIKSNRESGKGRYDICLFPREQQYPGIIMELKWKSKLDENALDALAQEAFQQIEEMAYDSEMKVSASCEVTADMLNGICKNTADGNWYYYRNGIVDRTYTNVGKNANGWWYVKNGQVDFSYTGVKSNENGSWRIFRGKVDFNCNDIVKSEDGWWYVRGGKEHTTSRLHSLQCHYS